MELPGWSGIWLWRHRHPDYKGWGQPVAMLDYLAVRLILERLYSRRLCAEEWEIAPNLGALSEHFGNHPAEFLVRWSLFSGPLPEYLASRAQRLVRSRQDTLEQARPEHWHPLANSSGPGVGAPRRCGWAGISFIAPGPSSGWPSIWVCRARPCGILIRPGCP